MSPQYTLVEEQVEYGLDKIDPNQMVEVSVRDLLYVFQTLSEFITFFHNPAHYRDLDAVKHFLGNRDSGAFKPLFVCYYDKMRDMLPEDVRAEYDGGVLDNPNFPHYYEVADEH